MSEIIHEDPTEAQFIPAIFYLGLIDGATVEEANRRYGPFSLTVLTEMEEFMRWKDSDTPA